jgi:copper chaperone CopZ
MNNTLAISGLLAVAGALSFCGLCEPSTRPAAGLRGLVSTAHAAPAPAQALEAPRPEGAQAQTPVRPAMASLTVTLAVKGMTCGGCVLATRKVLTRLPGVTKADVSYEKGTAVVTYDPAKVTVEQMIAAIKTLGYTAMVVAPAAG